MGSGRRTCGPASVSSHSLCRPHARHAQCSAEAHAARLQTSPPFLNSSPGHLRFLPVPVMRPGTPRPQTLVGSGRACLCHLPGTSQSSACPHRPPGQGVWPQGGMSMPCPHARCFPRQGEKSVSVDGKCSDSALLSGLLEEVRATLAKC